jgi:hypothetical protein
MYINQLHPYMHQNMSAYNGQLYQYLHHQQQPTLYHNYMYSQEHTHGHAQQNSQQKRY